MNKLMGVNMQLTIASINLQTTLAQENITNLYQAIIRHSAKMLYYQHT